MKRWSVYAAAWALAAAASTLVAWNGVRLVSQQVTAGRPASLSSEEIRVALDHPESPQATESEPSPNDGADDVPSTTPAATDTPTTSGTAGTSSTPSVPTTSPGSPVTAAGTTPTTRPSARPTTTTATPVSSAPPATAAPSTTRAPAAPTTRTYTLVGGTAALQFSPSGVTTLWATPTAGFEVRIEAENGTGVKVEFRGDGRTSRVDGWWADGPADRIRES